MLKVFLLVTAFFFGSLAVPAVHAQADASIRTFEIISLFDHSGKTPVLRREKGVGCLNLVTLDQRCPYSKSLVYGERAGVNWDIFQIVGNRTRMVRIGKYQFTDSFEVPEIEPWRELEPGEQGRLSFNLSGADGEHGRSGDGAAGIGPPVREGFADKSR
jgi:hypothetical protein